MMSQMRQGKEDIFSPWASWSGGIENNDYDKFL
jgi:hypothetical protein